MMESWNLWLNDEISGFSAHIVLKHQVLEVLFFMYIAPQQ